MVRMAKMFLVVAVPVVALIGMCGLNLMQARQLQTQSIEAQDSIDKILRVDDLVTDLQVERGTTATYLSSKGANQDAYTRVQNVRRKTDSSLNNLRYP
jgi:hypothetical protein